MSEKPGEVAPGDAGVPPEWASGAAITDPTSGQASYIEPPAGVKATGYVPYRLKPPRNWDNWLLRQNYLWQQYFDVTSQRAATVVVAAVDASADSRRMADYVCDGVEDDVQILAAIADSAASGGIVQLTEGTFTIDNSLLLTTTVCLRGRGVATLIRATAASVAAYDFVELGAECTVRDLQLSGTPAGAATNTGIRMNNVHGCLVRNVRIVGMVGGYGIHLTDGTENHIESCRIDLCQLAGIRADETGVVQRRVYVRDVSLTDNGVASSQVEWGCSGSDLVGLGLDASPAAGHGIRILGGEHIRILGGQVYDHGGTGVLVDAGDHVMVTGLMVDTAAIDGIVSSATDTLIEGCDIHDVTGVGIILGGTGSSVRGSRIADCTSTGVDLAAAECACENTHISTIGSNGITISTPGHRCIVADNFITGAQSSGIYALMVNDVHVSGNRFGINGLANGADTADIRIRGCARPKVHGNQRMETLGQGVANQVEYALLVQASAGGTNSTEVMITDNLFRVARLAGNDGVPGGGAGWISSIMVAAAQTVLGYSGFALGNYYWDGLSHVLFLPVRDSNQQIL